jgi:predicted SAM-dependent methyltransferase
MRNFPKHLNSAQDYDYVLKHFPKHEYIKSFQNLKDDYKKWTKEEKLAKKEDGLTDATSKVVEEEDENKEKVYHQYRFKVDEYCKIKRLGMKIKDINKILKEQRIEEKKEILK